VAALASCNLAFQAGMGDKVCGSAAAAWGLSGDGTNQP
jgi:hypothetical protein